jgi:hypothetical protein
MTNMKARNQVELTSRIALRRELAARTAGALLALATAAIPAIAAEESGAASNADPAAIRPFHVHFSDEALTDLRRRLAATQWPEKELVSDHSQGVPLATMKELVRYWQTGERPKRD